MIGDRDRCRPLIRALPLHDDMTTSSPHFREAVAMQDRTDLLTGENPRLTQSPPQPE